MITLQEFFAFSMSVYKIVKLLVIDKYKCRSACAKEMAAWPLERDGECVW